MHHDIGQRLLSPCGNQVEHEQLCCKLAGFGIDMNKMMSAHRSVLSGFCKTISLFWFLPISSSGKCGCRRHEEAEPTSLESFKCIRSHYPVPVSIPPKSKFPSAGMFFWVGPLNPWNLVHSSQFSVNTCWINKLLRNRMRDIKGLDPCPMTIHGAQILYFSLGRQDLEELNIYSTIPRRVFVHRGLSLFCWSPLGGQPLQQGDLF